MQTNRIALLQCPIGDRSGSTDSQLLQFGANAIVDIKLRNDVEKEYKGMGSGRFVDVTLHLHSARGRFPIDAAQAITIHIVTHTSYTRGIFQQALRGPSFSEGMATRQAKTVQRGHKWIHEQILTIGKFHFATDEAEDIAATQFCGSKSVNAACITQNSVTTRYPLIPAWTKQAFERNQIRTQAIGEFAPLNREGAWYRICDLQPGQGQ